MVALTPVELWRAFQRTIEFLRRRRSAYSVAFSGGAGHDVLKDLAKFCRANETCWDIDPRKHAMLEGRREVWLRIQAHLNLTPDKLYELFGGIEVANPYEGHDQ